MFLATVERGGRLDAEPAAVSRFEKKEDDEDDRAGFFLFPFFRGKRIEMIPPLLLFAFFLYCGVYVWERPAPPAPTATAPVPCPRK